MRLFRSLLLGVAGSAALLAQAQAQPLTTTEANLMPMATDAMPAAAFDNGMDMPAAPLDTQATQTAADTATMTQVKLEDGRVVRFPSSPEKSWQEHAREQGFDRFTFDPESGLFVVGKGDTKFDATWDAQGRRIPTVMKPVAKPAAKPAMKKAETVAAEVDMPAEMATDMPTGAAADVSPVAPLVHETPAMASPTGMAPADAAPAEVVFPAEVSPSATGHGAAAHDAGTAE